MSDTEDTKRNPLVVFKENFNRLVDAKELALPSNVSEEAFRNAAIIAVQDNPDLLNADQQSLFKSIRRAAASGLVPDGREGALVTFKTKDKASNSWINKVQWMPMVFGLIKMVRRSGTVRDIRAHVVYQRELDEERFRYVIGDNEKLEHEPILFGDRGQSVAAYAIAKLSDGTIVREFMSGEDIDKVRRAGSSQRVYEKGKAPVVSDEPLGIWRDWEPEMWKKTVIRRLTKRLDMSSEDMRHIQEDDDFEGLRDVTPQAAPISKFAQKALDARAAAEPTETPTDDIEDAQEVDAEPHWTEGFDTGEAYAGSEVWQEGEKAHAEGVTRTDCPYQAEPLKAADWLAAWDSAAESE